MQKSKYARYELDQSPFYCLKSKAKLAKLLRVSQIKLKLLTNTEHLYIESDIFDPKRGKSRRFEKPRQDLKRVQKRIEELLKRIKVPNYIHAPAKGRSYISNAKAHVNATEVKSLDIEKYFPSTPAKRIDWFFRKQMKCSSDVAYILTKLSTFKDHLPTGSPSSPMLSYFAHIGMWEAINEIVDLANCTLTIYIDDVTISGDHIPSELIWQVRKQFHRYGLRSNKKKEKHYIGKNSYEITGIIATNQGELKIPNRQHLKMHQCRRLLKLDIKFEKGKDILKSLRGLEAQRQQIRKANNDLIEI
ncbi:reverse transcriptase family protein [Nostoc sp.]|uniref:reverse transcriptase family protein n=1 Tax=Nostoc sp. TaxID=1180 RepID=UPI00359438DF